MIGKKYNNNDIVSMKLGSGEEIIAKVVEDGDKFLIVSKPVTLVVTQHGAAMTQFMMTQDISLTAQITKSQIVSIALSGKTAQEQYLKTITSLQTPVNIKQPEHHYGPSFEKTAGT
jgi:hypothetical protein